LDHGERTVPREFRKDYRRVVSKKEGWREEREKEVAALAACAENIDEENAWEFGVRAAKKGQIS